MMTMTWQQLTPPRLLAVRFYNASQGKHAPSLRVELIDFRDSRVVASFDDFKLAHDWLRQHHYGHTPVSGGVWVRDTGDDPSAP